MTARLDQIELRRRYPPRAKLDHVAVVPFVDDDMSRFMPGLAAQVNGKDVIARLDTGGTFLVSSPEVARSLGVELTCGGTGNHAFKATALCYGVAKVFRLGEVEMTNVPVATLASLGNDLGGKQQVIFGTSILERFLSTVDYPKRRLILSPAGDAARTAQHLALLAPNRVEMPFYLWGDHFMFAHGAVGDRSGLTFFIDSGLVALHKIGDVVRQAAFHPPVKKLLDWGLLQATPTKAGFLDPHLDLALGPLRQPAHLFFYSPHFKQLDFGGVRIDGILSHAFLSRYAWTVDFARRRYVFSWPTSGAAIQR